MAIFLEPTYLVVAYDLMCLFMIILLGLSAIGERGELGQFGYVCLYLGLATWAGVTGMIGPGVAQ